MVPTRSMDVRSLSIDTSSVSPTLAPILSSSDSLANTGMFSIVLPDEIPRNSFSCPVPQRNLIMPGFSASSAGRGEGSKVSANASAVGRIRFQL